MENIYINPSRSSWSNIISRSRRDDSDVAEAVKGIIETVRTGGDAALKDLEERFDKVRLDNLEVSAEEIAKACDAVPEALKDAIRDAARGIRTFHEAQMPSEVKVETAPGVTCIQRPVPIQKVGLYIPGGSAPLFSTVLMLAIPASIAGCEDIMLCTPPSPQGISPEILFAAKLCGIHHIYKVGGAQAIAAMAVGTETISKRDKIFGPGNRFVMKAKQILSQEDVAIDMPAGPSEVMVLADHTAVPEFVAADLLSQAEHGPDSQVMLVCTSVEFAKAVDAVIELQTKALGRSSTIYKALEGSRIVIFEDRKDIVNFANAYAAEHLIISMSEPWSIASEIKAAGSIFIGNMSPESAGDYASGTNHTLPTSGWARSFSGVNIDSFIRKITYQELTPAGLSRLAGTIVAMAEAEGLDAHANAVKVRMNAAGQSIEKPVYADDVVALMRRNIASLEPYSTARDDFQGVPDVLLDANESPYENGVNRYPDPRQKSLKKKIADIKGITPDRLFIGNGSDEAIDLCFRVFCRPGVDNAVSINPSYGMYQVAAATNDVELRKVSLRDDFSLDAEALVAACDRNTKLIFICSPNNPTGNSFAVEDILYIYENFGGIIVVDEAYIDFSSARSLVDILPKHPRIVILQTLSKAWGMAGLRVGLAIADQAVISVFDKVKYPYNLSSINQATALKHLDPAKMQAHVAEILSEREKLMEALPGVPGVVKIYPSDANFILVQFTDPQAVYDMLVEKGIIVRNRNTTHLCKGCLRLTIGTPAENERLLNALNGVSGNTGGRSATISRKTSETDICVSVDLDRSGSGSTIDTGLKFLDHMLMQIPHHGGFHLDIKASGDLEVDEHHTMEDVAIVLGEAIVKALGNKAGIGRYGFALPMDESEAIVLLDFGGRAEYQWDVKFTREFVGDTPTEMFSHFFQSFSNAAKCNLHIKAHGENNHHIAEAVFKAFARSLRMAVAQSGFPYELPSSKGVL